MTDGGYVLGPGEGRVLDMGPFRMSVKAEAAQTGGAFSLLEAEEPAGFGPPLHVHDDAAEAFYVLDGEYIVFLDGREHRCPAGSFMYIPAGQEHGFRVGSGPSRKLNLYLPAAMIGYFDALADATADGVQLGEDALTEIAAQHAMRVLGPVPEGYL
jgi:mannose-6-phosphate isomerase-like protein (cupin superfamily)